jgi:hypothetical protein
MSINRTARRIDANQHEIVQALRDAGCAVAIVGQPIDLFVSKDGKTWAIEIKDGAKPPSQRRLERAQIEFFSKWQGRWAIVESAAQALELVSR